VAKKLSVVVITITPFTDDGKLDEGAYRKQLRRLAAEGCSVYFAGSGTSEAYSFTPEERDRVMAISVEELKGKVPSRAMGCEPRTIDEMIDFMRAAERAGVDAAQIFSLEIGHGIHPTPAELDKYYKAVIEATSLPVYLSSHQLSGYVLPLDLVETLVRRFPKQVSGIAYYGTDIPYIAELIARVGDEIEVHCAAPMNAMAVLGLGGNGFMGGEGNFSPKMVASVINAWKAKDMAAVATSFSKLMAFAGAYSRHGGGHAARGLKPLMNKFGLPGGYLRSPRLPLPAPQVDEFAKLVDAMDLPGIPKLEKLKA
jgi:4-hydroxy-tetrahydrodipicolinate synthase